MHCCRIISQSSNWLRKQPGLSKLGAIQKRVYADLRKGIGFEIDKDVGSIKMAEKRARTTKCCPSLISATNRFGVYAAP